MNAQTEYNRLLANVREEIYGSTVGFGEFLARSELYESPEFRRLLLALVNRKTDAEALRNLVDDMIEQYAQNEAESRQFGRGHFPKPPKPADPQEFTRLVHDIFGMPRPLQDRVDAARGIKK